MGKSAETKAREKNDKAAQRNARANQDRQEADRARRAPIISRRDRGVLPRNG